MFFICSRCGQFRADQIVDPADPAVICPECGNRQPFKFLPLMVVGGASGSGKTAVCRDLLGRGMPVVLLDSDILWRPEFNTPDTHYQEFFETWLRMALNIGQSARPVVLFGAGFGVPENLETCVGHRYFSQVHYHALVCSSAEIEARLKQRPTWRGSAEPEFLAAQIRFNQWFLDYAGTPEITLTDTSGQLVRQAGDRVASWINEILRRESVSD